MAEIAKSFFGPGTPGMIMLGVLLAGLITFLGERFLVSIGKGTWSIYYKTGMEIAAILSVVGVALTLLGKIFGLSQGNGF
ncbi:hypothetical protein Desde_3139 [Desulfitobacterium dehalogenans ATCC 51507]|uniref:Uncharacterized protein n=1 Tax=Desulfitobacterium dehalogenans (strain ATCC 51507 / DSM 9161 / JW/IU-DC1) TaxID=756499 RepID=I4ABU6_DESDJ|nr:MULTISPECIES: hypothetical protein [Desulfitobacterium]AFM01431.1 hypothetical protein Desde_3139 [Desulfitobacterium dehalogenans ATCC 51507]